MQNYEQYLSILRTIKTSDPSKGVAQEYGYLAICSANEMSTGG